MAEPRDQPLPAVPYGLLDPDEQVHAEAQADDGAIIVTDRRVAVALNPDQFHLDVPFKALRRIQFDIERERPATLVIVPEHTRDVPVVWPSLSSTSLSRALAVLGQRLHDVSTSARENVSVETRSSVGSRGVSGRNGQAGA